MSSGTINDELREFIKGLVFTKAHTRLSGPPFLDLDAGDRFLRATLDEVRLHHAERFARGILQRFDLDDAMFFHEAVLSRELTGQMAYDRQRDHAAHTVNNYLLGWLLFDRSPVIRTAVTEAINRRRPSTSAEQLNARFGNVWIWASLLHDVGYLFEGNLQTVDTAVQHSFIEGGARVVRDYFEHRFWFEVEGNSTDLRRDLCEAGTDKLTIPRIDRASLASVATSLVHMPITKSLLGQLEGELGKDFAQAEFPHDAFAIWERHFASYRYDGMQKRITAVRRWFESILWDGVPGLGIRVLDHGVCSGLLLLMYSTFYFAAVAEAKSGRRSQAVNDWLKNQEDRATVRFRSWWEYAVWGTGSAAIHNIVQVALGPKAMKTVTGSPRYPQMEKLKLEEDPIAYLGLLVDLLQDWDRYAVRRGAYVLNRGLPSIGLPLQSSEIRLRVDSGVVILEIENQARLKQICEDLSTYLHDWSAVVDLKAPATS